MVVLEALSSINIPTKDIVSSLDFYTNFLDFEVIQQDETKVVLNFDNIQVALIPSETPFTNVKLPFLSFILDVDDFTDAIQEIEERGVQVVEGPSFTRTEERIYIQDPNGNVIELFYKED